MRSKILIFCSIIALYAFVLFLLPPISQFANYHDFADQRVFLTIPHAGDVLSNLPLFLCGIWGLYVLSTSASCLTKEERTLWLLLFVSVIISSIFSAYYHLAPDNFRLMWDRLGLSLIFTLFFSLMLAERIKPKIGLFVAPFLVFIGIMSVFYWATTGDLRFYGGIQFGSFFLLIPLCLLFPSSLPGRKYLYLALALYAVAKICELADWQLFTWLGGTLSGHNLKHIISAGSAAAIVLYLRSRCKLQSRQQTK